MFQAVKLKTSFHINRIVTIHYFEYAKHFAFTGERHNFWEIVYVDRGEIEAFAGDQIHLLKQGEAIFHQPEEYHNIRTSDVFANVAIVTFYCEDEAMDFFCGRTAKLNPLQQELLAQILKEGKDTFEGPLNQLLQQSMKRRKTPLFGSEQMIKLYLEQFLISVVRTNLPSARNSAHYIKNENENAIVDAILLYLRKNLNRALTLDRISEEVCFSKSYIKRLFSQKKGEGIMEYFTGLKIDEAKRLISEQELTFTQISDLLGFSSIHYFSRVFQKRTGMSPRDYSKSVKKSALL